jgi:hypothetical protein
MNKATVNLIVGVTVAALIFYLSESNSTVALLAIAGIGYLIFSNGLIHV